MPHDLDYFFRRLAERNANADKAEALDTQLWQELGIEQAILVGDLSGFTRLTKKRGILHFLALHFRGVRIAEPIVARLSGTMVKSEADNIIACFPHPVEAATAAIELQRVVYDYNLRVADHDSEIHYCMGIGFGRVLRLTDDVFGDEVNVAYKLGEDVARPGEILVSEPAHAAIVARSTDFAFSAPTQADSGNVSLGFHRLAVH